MPSSLGGVSRAGLGRLGSWVHTRLSGNIIMIRDMRPCQDIGQLSARQDCGELDVSTPETGTDGPGWAEMGL